MASANGNDGIVIVLIMLVAVVLFALLKSSKGEPAKTSGGETKYDNITVNLKPEHTEQKQIEQPKQTKSEPTKPSVPSPSEVDQIDKSTTKTNETNKTEEKKSRRKKPARKDAEFFIEQMRKKEATVASMQTPTALLTFYDVSSVPAKHRARDTTEFARFSSKLSRLGNVGATGDMYADINMNTFHSWEMAVNKTDQQLLKQLPLSDQTHNTWYKAAVNFSDGKRPCSNVTISLHQLTSRMRRTAAKINATDKEIVEERLLVDLLLCFFEIYSLIVLHEECCSIGAALSRDANAKETLRVSFAETWYVVSRRFFSWYNRVPSLIPAIGLLQRGNENVCSMLSRLLDQRGNELLPRVLVGAQVLFHPLSTTVPTFMQDSSYTRLSTNESLTHLHTDKQLFDSSTNSTAKKMSQTNLDVWYKSDVLPGDNMVGICLNESTRPLPHIYAHNVGTVNAWQTMGEIMSCVEQDALFDLEMLNHLVGKMERNEGTHLTATDSVYVCQNSRLSSVSEQLDGVSVAQLFSGYERGVEQELIVNSFITQNATPGQQQPTLVLNILISSTLKKTIPTVPLVTSVTVFNLCSLPHIDANNFKQAYILSAYAPSTTNDKDKPAFLNDEHCLVRVPPVDPNYNSHALVIDATNNRVFLKRNQSNNTRTSMLLRLSHVGNLQLVVVQRLTNNNSDQETLDRITVGIGDQEYGSTVKAFDRKIRNNERSFLQGEETFDYAGIDSYTNSMKRNCLNFLYS